MFHLISLTDIDECKDEEHNNCIELEYCVNKNGSFNCICPKGYDGDGRREGKGCNLIIESSESPVLRLVAG